ncbi:MAG: hypothetical protein ACM3ML_19000 [Micromonosporaceae bacterium]
MIDTERLRALQSSLAADGYEMQVLDRGGRMDVSISASPEACADCLVPKQLMRGILKQVLGVAEDAIDLTYPRDFADPQEPRNQPEQPR